MRLGDKHWLGTNTQLTLERLFPHFAAFTELSKHIIWVNRYLTYTLVTCIDQLTFMNNKK